MLVLLGEIGDYVLVHVPVPVALLIRLPVLIAAGYCLLWVVVRGVLRVAAVGMSPLSRVLAHALWYVLLMPEAWLSMRAVRRSMTPSSALYVYGEQVEILALSVRKLLGYLARLLASLSRTPKTILFWVSFVWAVVALLGG
jgi:hypothetical protein